MKISGFVSLPPRTPYAPTWDFTIGTSLCSEIDLKNLTKTILDKEEDIKKLPTMKDIHGEYIDAYTGLSENSTTARFGSYNVLTWATPETEKLKEYILQNLVVYNNNCGNQTPNEVWAQCWVNILGYEEYIAPHLHSTGPDTYLSGHFNVQTEHTSTLYMSPINQLNDPDVIEVVNVNGEMTLFPSYIFHYTTPNLSNKSRITIAFDLNYNQLAPNWIKLQYESI